MDARTPPDNDPDKSKFAEGNAFFKSVGGIKSETEVQDYQEGGVSDSTRKLIGANKWPILLIALGALAVLAGGLIFLGTLFDQPSGDEPTSTPTPTDNPAFILPLDDTSAPPAASGCTCSGVDQICTQADGSQTVSYNSTACGGSGECQCRDPNKTLVCPDGTYADFNPQCGVGGGDQCPCVCDQFDANQQCVAGHKSCEPAVTCLP